jgi:hypothetical protein
MRRRGQCLLPIVFCLIVSARVAAQPPCSTDERGGVCPSSSYSCWHFLTPTLFRLHNAAPNRAAYLYATESCAPVTGSYRVTVFPCRAVDQPTYYADRSPGK